MITYVGFRLGRIFLARYFCIYPVGEADLINIKDEIFEQTFDIRE